MNTLNNVSDSFSPLKPNVLCAEVQEWFASLPPVYQALLQAHNGGFVESTQYEFSTGVPYQIDQTLIPSHTDCVVEFFGIPMPADQTQKISDVYKQAVDNDLDEFLPGNVIAIARCLLDSLICLSISGPDKGTVYYWEVYWNTPNCEDFFNARIAQVYQQYGDVEGILHNLEHPQYQEVYDAINYATLVKLADSIPEWLAMCHNSEEIA